VRKRKIVVIYGQTASGKSELAIKIAQRFSGEIVSADSVQIYRGFDIGSAKIEPEKRMVPHHLIDIKEPDQDYCAADFATDAQKIIEEIFIRGNLPIVTGGTNFYIKAVTEGINNNMEIPYWVNRFVIDAYREKKDRLQQLVRITDPQRAQELSPNDTYRLEKALSVYLAYGKSIKDFKSSLKPAFIPIKIGIITDKERLKRSIEKRVYKMFSSGIIKETRAISKKYGSSVKPLSSIGYKQALAVINEKMTIDEAIKEAIKESIKYAKRQATWLKKETGIAFFRADDNKLFDYIENALTNR